MFALFPILFLCSICRGTFYFGESTDTISGWIYSGCVGTSTDDGDYRCGPYSKCIAVGGYTTFNKSYLSNTWTVPTNYSNWTIRFSIGSSTFNSGDSIEIKYLCANMTDYCTVVRFGTECNRNLGCLNTYYHLTPRCDHVDSISLQFVVSHDDLNDIAYIKQISFYYNEKYGADIVDSCYLDPTSMSPTTAIPTITPSNTGSNPSMSTQEIEITDNISPETSIANSVTATMISISSMNDITHTSKDTNGAYCSNCTNIKFLIKIYCIIWMISIFT